jgi:hypothetical protein
LFTDNPIKLAERKDLGKHLKNKEIPQYKKIKIRQT